MKAVFILSTKSSGSTALQNYLKYNYGYHTVEYTQHQEEETLYWSKVASIVGLHQNKMYRSKVPFSPEKAIDDLNIFYKKNRLKNIKPTVKTSEEEFQDFFYQLIKNTGNKFVEKSPHHLFNESNLELIYNFKQRYGKEVDILVLGLVRHPISVVYSAWNRWKYIPKEFELEYKESYENLLKWKEKLDIRLINYEDLAKDRVLLDDLIGEKKIKDSYQFKSNSLYKWESDNEFGYRISAEVEDLAVNLGYTNFDNKCGSVFKWHLMAFKFKLIYNLKLIAKKLTR